MTVVKQLGMFAKYWAPGQVKTRLARDLGVEQTSRLYRCFVETLVRRFAWVAERNVLAFTPNDSQDAFRKVVCSTWNLTPQAEGDLGQRMEHYFASAFSSGATQVVLIGSDCPHLPMATLRRAFSELQQHSVVLGPSDDGGYYLVGAAQDVPPIFAGIDWSTPAVWSQTVDCLETAGCDYACLEPTFDIDDLNDLRRLRDELSALIASGHTEQWQFVLWEAVQAAWRSRR